jgi:hypothetical protein
MALSKKHFENTARRIRNAVNAINTEFDPVSVAAMSRVSILRNLACDLAFDFRQENPRFDEARFLAACGF